MAGTPDAPTTQSRAHVPLPPVPRRQFKVEAATKEQRKLRLALISYEGQGKTVSALKIATRLWEQMGSPASKSESGRGIVLADSEGDSARIYADAPPGVALFDRIPMTDHSPDAFIDLIAFAEEVGWTVLIIDSFSHEYTGAGGVLEGVDALKQQGGFGWDKMTPKHRRVLEAIVRSKVHIIATLRQKKDWVKEIGPNGRERLIQQGTAAVQREQTEFEFDVIGTLQDATLTVTKARDLTGTIKAGQSFDKPGAEFADVLLRLVTAGVPPKPIEPADVVGIPEVVAPLPGKPITEAMLNTIAATVSSLGDKSRDGRNAIATKVRELGYANWADFNARGHDDFTNVFVVAQSFVSKPEPKPAPDADEVKGG